MKNLQVGGGGGKEKEPPFLVKPIWVNWMNKKNLLENFIGTMTCSTTQR